MRPSWLQALFNDAGFTPGKTRPEWRVLTPEPPQEPPCPHLAALGLAEGATRDEIRRAYRRLARETHPDVAGGNRESFERIRDAWEALEERL
jgi:hypothetical protein